MCGNSGVRAQFTIHLKKLLSVIMKKNTFTVPAPMAEAAHRKAERRNLWTYPVGTVGRDMIYQLFTNYILTYTLFTRELTAAQLAAITGIMIAARKES